MFDVARCWRFLGGLAFARDAMKNYGERVANSEFIVEKKEWIVIWSRNEKE